MTCNEKCIHRTVCELKKYDCSYIVDCKHYEEPKPQGEWLHKEIDSFFKVYGQCSRCLHRERVGNFCRNCGADMRK